MPLLRPTPPLLQSTTPRSSLTSRIASLLGTKSTTTPLPILPDCPPSTCTCRSTPPNLDIDHKSPIANNIAPYHAHILISTGRSDWPSRIEDSRSASTQAWAGLTADLKAAFGRHGRYLAAGRNTLVTASSLPPSDGGGGGGGGRTVVHFPSWREYSIPNPPALSTPKPPPSEEGGVAAGSAIDEDLARLLDHLTGPASSSQSPSHSQSQPTSSTSELPPLPPRITSTPISTPTILICTHNSRDTRCGILGPLLQAEFRDQLQLHPPSLTTSTSTSTSSEFRIAGISHIGGHKWAGNVVVYIPPDWKLADEGMSPLAGKAIWYGRVEPRHVEGILRETVFGGKVIGELCRGVVVVDGSGGMVRI